MLSTYYKQSLMYRIYVVFFARKVLCPRGLGISWLVLSSFGMLWFVSVLNVIRNFFAASNDFGSAYGFVTHSFTHTSLVVQAMLVGFFAVGNFLLLIYTEVTLIHNKIRENSYFKPFIS